MVPKYNIEAVAGEAAAGPEVASSQSSAGEADSDEPRDSTPAFRSSIGRSLNRLLSEARGGDAEGDRRSASTATSVALGILSSLAAPDKQRRQRAAQR